MYDHDSCVIVRYQRGTQVPVLVGSFADGRSSDMPDASQIRLVCPTCGAIYRTDFEGCALDGAPLVPYESDPLIGRTLAERYHIEELVSEGAMGRVYRATHTRMSKRFAVKVLFGDHAAQTRMRARFKREAEAASRLEHPNLVSVVDFGETDSRLLYLVMDFIEGRTCSELVEEEGPLDEQRALRLVREIARGLRHLHSRDMVHRDLKLDNVLVSTDGEVETPRIVDLGVALLPSDEITQERLTKQGTIVGTPAFMAPEQAFGDDVDPRSDIFSLGMLFYHLLAGRGPFEGTAVEIIQQNVTQPFPPVEERNPDVTVSRDVERLLDRMIEKHASDRFESAQSVIDAIDRIRPVSMPPSMLTAPATHMSLAEDLSVLPGKTTVSRRWQPLVLAALAGLVAATVAGIALTRDSTDPSGNGEVAELAAPAPEDLEEDLVDALEDEEEDVVEEGDSSDEPALVAPKKPRKRKKRRVKRRRRKARPKRKTFGAIEKTDTSKARRAPTVSEITDRSNRVAKLIRRVEDKHGRIAAGPLRTRLLPLSTPTADTSPRELHRMKAELVRLERAARRELRN